MLNLNDFVTITRKTTGIDPATGTGTVVAQEMYWEAVRCQLVPLRAGEVVSAWVDVPDLVTGATYATLILPQWIPVLPEDGHRLADYTFAVGGWPWTFRAEAVKVWPEFTTYRLCASV